MAAPARDLIGRVAFSRDGSRLGRVKQALGEGPACYLVIGRFLGRELVVPEPAAEERDDQVWLPFATAFLSSSPRVRTRTGLSDADRERLDRFYGRGCAA